MLLFMSIGVWYIITDLNILTANMKQFIKSLLANFFILFFVVSLFKDGIVLPKISLYLFATLLILTMTVLIASPLLKFLTIKRNFITHFIITTLLLIGVFFLLKTFMTGLFINSYTFKELTFASLQINSFTVNPVLTIVSVSLLSSLICSIYEELDSV